MPAVIKLDRNFLHSGGLELVHPRTKQPLKFSRPLPEDLQSLMDSLEGSAQKDRSLDTTD
jgi:hypothetical protein